MNIWVIFELLKNKLLLFSQSNIIKWIKPRKLNLKGDRDIEYSWVSANIPGNSGNALDFGCGSSYMGLLAARKGYNVTAIDINPPLMSYKHRNLKFMQGNIYEFDFRDDNFDLIINISSIEHVGLKGRYGVKKSIPNGDIEVMGILRSIIKKNCKMILTIPVGRDIIYMPYHRVYGAKRLPLLLKGWEIVEREFWVKNDKNLWYIIDQSKALSKKTSVFNYGLGLFVLKK